MKALALIALLAASPLYAGSSSVIYTEESQPGELMPDFVQRIAPRMAQRTNATGHEVCGVIEFQGETMRVEVRTSRSPNSCFIPGDLRLAYTVHTHPKGVRGGLGPNDHLVSGYVIQGNRIWFHDFGANLVQVN